MVYEEPPKERLVQLQALRNGDLDAAESVRDLSMTNKSDLSEPEGAVIWEHISGLAVPLIGSLLLVCVLIAWFATGPA
jgi:hypothetical protein